jgi:large subunit ribosomal protein L15
MRLHDLKSRPGATHRRKRLGQGESSGHGKTSGRGGKGQTARSGSSIRIGFEGGQMPLIRRIPKRGFNNARFASRYVPVNLEALNRFEDGATVDVAKLRELGLASGPVKQIKILGDGELTRKLSVQAHAFSASARAKIEKLGGACQLIETKKPAEKAPGKRAQARAANPPPQKAKPAEEKAEPAEAKAKPTLAKGKPAEAKAKPAEAKAKPAEAKAKPAEAKAKPAEAKAKPAEAKVEPAEKPAGNGPEKSA